MQQTIAIFVASTVMLMSLGIWWQLLRNSRGRCPVEAYEDLIQHRLRNPIAIAQGAAQTLLDDSLELDAQTRKQLLEAVADGVLRISELSLEPRLNDPAERCLASPIRRR